MKVVMLSFVALFTCLTPADATVLCKTRHAAVVARDTACGPRESLALPPAPVAYAHVLDDGTLDAASSYNMSGTSMWHGVGLYCFANLPFTPRHATVTLDADGGIGPLYVVVPRVHLGVLPEFACLDPTAQVSVVLTYPEGYVDWPFFITFN
jgi:hypothetical protein